jgi:hypothetical protein
MLRAMKTAPLRLAPILALLLAPAAAAAVSLEGEVALDYYVADGDAEGFETTAAEFFVEEIANGSAARSGPLALAGWATTTTSPAGAGDEIGYLPVGTVGGGSSLRGVAGTTPADDLLPGEYYAHVLLQDERHPGTFDDARTLAPRLLWRGGLQAAGPLSVRANAFGDFLTVAFRELRNNRLDNRFTNDIALTLYATHGFGPASAGHELCRVTVAGLYAGDVRQDPAFGCAVAAIPDGEYTVHVEVAEIGGRGGSSTLSGPDVRVRDGLVGPCCGYGYYDGSLYVAAPGAGVLLALAALAPLRRRRLRAGARGPGAR